MSTSRKYTEKTAADGASAGFDFQYYYFLYQLIRLRSNESIGLEVKDDVHLTLSDGTLVLLQLKHTVQKKTKGECIK